MFRIGEFEKLTFFETTKFQYQKIKRIKCFRFIPVQISHKFLGIIDWIQFLGCPALLWRAASSRGEFPFHGAFPWAFSYKPRSSVSKGVMPVC